MLHVGASAGDGTIARPAATSAPINRATGSSSAPGKGSPPPGQPTAGGGLIPVLPRSQGPPAPRESSPRRKPAPRHSPREVPYGSPASAAAPPAAARPEPRAPTTRVPAGHQAGTPTAPKQAPGASSPQERAWAVSRRSRAGVRPPGTAQQYTSAAPHHSSNRSPQQPRSGPQHTQKSQHPAQHYQSTWVSPISIQVHQSANHHQRSRITADAEAQAPRRDPAQPHPGQWRKSPSAPHQGYTSQQSPTHYQSRAPSAAAHHQSSPGHQRTHPVHSDHVPCPSPIPSIGVLRHITNQLYADRLKDLRTYPLKVRPSRSRSCERARSRAQPPTCVNA